MKWKAVKLELIGMAGAFNIPITEPTVMWYANALSHLDPEVVLLALREYGRTTKVQKLPSPAQLTDLINPKLNPENEAREASGRILAAVTKFGYIDPEGAKRYIGELGWETVQRFGGWQYVCEHLGSDLNMNTMFAQMRDVALAMYDRQSKGATSPPALPTSGKVLELAQSVVKKLE